MRQFILMILVFFTSCAIEGERFRLRTRIDTWYTILTPSQIQLFAENKTNELGQILDQQETTNPEFAEKLRKLRINEAIMSFNGTQTVHFFYNTLLRDLAKFSYQEFTESLSSAQLMSFLNKDFDSLTQFQSLYDDARNNFGFKDFTDEQILTYYREISFKANTFVLVYDWLSFFARFGALDVFLAGDFDSTMSIFIYLSDVKTSPKIALRRQSEEQTQIWNDLRSRAYFSKLSNKQVIEVVYQHVLPEMSPDVRYKTINNIKTLYKENK